MFSPLNDDFFGVLFGELAISQELFGESVKPLAVEGGIQREATLTAEEDEFSEEAQKRRWDEFLRDAPAEWAPGRNGSHRELPRSSQSVWPERSRLTSRSRCAKPRSHSTWDLLRTRIEEVSRMAWLR